MGNDLDSRHEIALRTKRMRFEIDQENEHGVRLYRRGWARDYIHFIAHIIDRANVPSDV